MSFSRAAIKRFNETADISIPAPGTYHPKFTTDVSANSVTRKISLDKCPRSPSVSRCRRSESSQNASKAGRNSSITRRSFTAVPRVEQKNSSTASVVSQKRVRSNSKIRPVPMKRSIPSTSNVEKKPSSVTVQGTKVDQNRVASSHFIMLPPATATSQGNERLGSTKGEEGQVVPYKNQQAQFKSESCLSNNVINNDMMTYQAVLEEIQRMAESLQAEVSEYKRRLTLEVMRNAELEARNLELEFLNQTLQREVMHLRSLTCRIVDLQST